MTLRRYTWPGLPPMVELLDLLAHIAPRVGHQRAVEIVRDHYAELAPCWTPGAGPEIRPSPILPGAWNDVVSGLGCHVSTEDVTWTLQLTRSRLRDPTGIGASVNGMPSYIFVDQEAAERLLSEATTPPAPETKYSEPWKKAAWLWAESEHGESRSFDTGAVVGYLYEQEIIAGENTDEETKKVSYRLAYTSEPLARKTIGNAVTEFRKRLA